jgi:hypothetical protein
MGTIRMCHSQTARIRSRRRRRATTFKTKQWLSPISSRSLSLSWCVKGSARRLSVWKPGHARSPNALLVASITALHPSVRWQMNLVLAALEVSRAAGADVATEAVHSLIKCLSRVHAQHTASAASSSSAAAAALADILKNSKQWASDITRGVDLAVGSSASPAAIRSMQRPFNDLELAATPLFARTHAVRALRSGSPLQRRSCADEEVLRAGTCSRGWHCSPLLSLCAR